jgi:predicted dehydrogenase
VPDQCNIIADYKDGPSVVMLNSLSNYTGVDSMIRGTDGVILWEMLGSKGCKGIRIVPHGKEETFLPWKGFGDTSKLWRNLLDCVKTRQQPFSSIELAVRVQAPLSMGVISHLENKVAVFDPEAESIGLS